MMTTKLTEENCIICKAAFPAQYHLVSNEYWTVRHSTETNILGYFILESRRHFLDLSEASTAESSVYGPMLAAVMKAQRDILQCPRVYTFSLAEAVPHFHVHVIPRAQEFARAYKGRGIMSYPPQPSADPHLVENIVQTFRTHLRRHIV